MFIDREIADYIMKEKLDRKYANWNDLYESFTTKFLNSNLVMFLLLFLIIGSFYLAIRSILAYIKILKNSKSTVNSKSQSPTTMLISCSVAIVSIILVGGYFHDKWLLATLNSIVPMGL